MERVQPVSVESINRWGTEPRLRKIGVYVKKRSRGIWMDTGVSLWVFKLTGRGEDIVQFLP